MSTLEVVRRLAAHRAGRPLPCGETRRFALAEPRDLLMVALVRMGGESTPWGIAWQRGDEPTPHVVTAPEPRNRDMLADMVARFAPVLLGHLRHPAHARDLLAADHRLPLRQVWVPNATHLEMLHNLGFAYANTKTGSVQRVALLRALGRAGAWLFAESQRAGQVVAMSATDVLRTAWTFPAEDVRLAHLGFLLAWLDTDGDLEARRAAAHAAEQRSIATTLEPTWERDHLVEPLAAFNAARNPDDPASMRIEAARIEALLGEPLAHRIALTRRALEWLRRDERPINAGIAELVARAHAEQYSQYWRFEIALRDDPDAFTPSPETDWHPPAAAARYNSHVLAAEDHFSLLAHDDTDLQLEAIERGDAFAGTIVDVRDENPGRAKQPVWTVRGERAGALRLRVGSDVCVAGMPKRTGRLREIAVTPDDGRTYEVEITGWKTVPRDDPGFEVLPATSRALVGRQVVMLSASKSGITRMKISKVWRNDGPGAWLTHGDGG